MRWIGGVCGVVVVVAAWGGVRTPGATCTWTGHRGSDWSAAGNWAAGAAPTNGDDLAFAAGVPVNAPSNNDLPNLQVRALRFANDTFSAPLALGGNPLALTGGLVNGNVAPGRDVTIGNAIAVAAPQLWGTTNSANAVTVVAGDLTGTHTVTVFGNQSNGGTKPTLRLAGTNAGFTGVCTFTNAFGGSQYGGLLLDGPAAMIGGVIDQSTTQFGLYLRGGPGVGPYTFGIGSVPQGGAGTVSFLNSGSGGLWLWGGDATWDPGNGGDYAWTNGAAHNYINLGGRAADALNAVLNIGNPASRLVLAGGGKFMRTGAPNNGPITALRSALADDGLARSFESSVGLLLLTRPAAGHRGGATTVSGGALAVAAMDRIFDGNLNLSGGVLVLDGLTWADFVADRASGYGPGTNQWRVTGGGFAARGAGVTISGGATNEFDTTFMLGSSARWTNDALYAAAAVQVAQAITLTTNRTIIALGGNQESTTRWLVNSPVHEVSGLIAEAGGGRILNLAGSDRQSPLNGTIRISNTGNSFSGGVRVNSTSAGGKGGGGGVIAIFPDDACFGPGPVYVGSGASGAAGLLLFENQGAGIKDFSKSFEVALGTDTSSGDSGFGSWAGRVLYRGTVTVSGAKTTVPVHVQAGTLAFGAGSSLFNDSAGGTQSYNKAGAGELVLDTNVLYVGANRDVQWVLRAGTLTTVVDNKLAGGAAVFSGGNLLSIGFNATSPARTWNVVSNDQRYVSSSMFYGGNASVTVATGVTLTLNTTTNSSSPSEGAGNANTTARWALTKNGGGTWVFCNSNPAPAAAYGPQNGAGFIRVDEGTLDLAGDYGRGSLALNGGTLLSGTYSPFTYSSYAGPFAPGVYQPNLFEVTAAGGRIGISPAATGDVTRSVGFAWDQSAPHTLTLAARGDRRLVFNAALPAIAASTTLAIDHDGVGTGCVQVANVPLTVLGVLRGSGVLRVGAGGTNAVAVGAGGRLAPGGAELGTLTVQGGVAADPAGTLCFRLGTSQACDRLDVTGGVRQQGRLAVDVLPGAQGGLYPVIAYGGVLTGAGFTLVPPSGAWAAEVVTNVPGLVQVRLIRQSGALLRVR